jgi:hypothetical protein
VKLYPLSFQVLYINSRGFKIIVICKLENGTRTSFMIHYNNRVDWEENPEYKHLIQFMLGAKIKGIDFNKSELENFINLVSGLKWDDGRVLQSEYQQTLNKIFTGEESPCGLSLFDILDKKGIFKKTTPIGNAYITKYLDLKPSDIIGSEILDENKDEIENILEKFDTKSIKEDIKDIFRELEDNGFTIKVSFYNNDGDFSYIVNIYNNSKFDCGPDSEICETLLRLKDYLKINDLYMDYIEICTTITKSAMNRTEIKGISKSDGLSYSSKSGYGLKSVDFPIKRIQIEIWKK